MSVQGALSSILFVWSFTIDLTCANMSSSPDPTPTGTTNMFNALVSPGNGEYLYHDNIIRRNNDLSMLLRAGMSNNRDNRPVHQLNRGGQTSTAPGTFGNTSPSPPLSFREALETMRLRSRLRRIRHIRQKVGTFIGPTANVRSDCSQNGRTDSNTTIYYTPITAIHRSCHLEACQNPPGTDHLLWDSLSGQSMFLYFPVPRLRSHQGREEKVKTASLKFFVKPARGFSQTSNNVEELPDVKISVYQFIRPLSQRRKNRIINRSRLLDSGMVPSNGNLWARFNIKPAIATWMSRPRRNWGLKVTVTVNDTLVNARDFMVEPVCPKEQIDLLSTCRDDDGERIYQVLRQMNDVQLRSSEPYVDIAILDSVQEAEVIQRQLSMQRQISEERSRPYWRRSLRSLHSRKQPR